MKQIKIANYSVYSDGFYTSDESNFIKLYKGVRVNVENCAEDSRYMHFSIRTSKTRTAIWKRGCERMDGLVFDDAGHSITCDFANEPENKCPKVLVFEGPVYDELKRNIPSFMRECGCKFEQAEENGRTVLKF